MKCLEELEARVLHLIQKNAEFKIKMDELVRENVSFKEQVHQLEESLLREKSTFVTLENEKVAIKNVVEGLLSTINALENSSN